MKNITVSSLVVFLAAAIMAGRLGLGRRAVSPVSNNTEEMVLIPGTTTQMGIDVQDIGTFQKLFDMEGAELFEPEIPKHEVTVATFLLDKYLVTNAQFDLFLDASPVWRPGRIPAELHNGNYLRHWEAEKAPVKLAHHPVVNVSWYAAVAYCQWKAKRLPTEGEWEHAARGGMNGPFPWGSQPVDKTLANFAGSGINTTTAVGTYPANGYGLFDMAGNVWEYLADEYRPYWAGAQSNPVAGGEYFSRGDEFLRVKTRRVIRGGSYGGAAINLWVEYRDSHPPEGAKPFVGFRCAKSVSE
jgi:formylglycine-generating enzyme required for sulfatase activity